MLSSVRVHSNLAIKLGNKSKFYYLLRAIDEQGTGKITINKKELCSLLDISLRTFYRYLNDEIIIRNYYINKNNNYVIYLNGVDVMCAALDIYYLGACFDLSLSELNYINKQCVLAQVIKKQRQSYRAAQLNNKEHNKYKLVIDAEKVFNKIESEKNIGKKSLYIVNGALFYNNVLYMNQDCVKPIGGSQTKVASDLNISLKTVNRLLKNQSKIKQAVGSKEMYFIANHYEFLDKEEWGNQSGRYFKFSKHNFEDVNTFKSYCSLYKDDIQLSSFKYYRKKIKSKIDYINNSIKSNLSCLLYLYLGAWSIDLFNSVCLINNV